MTTGLLALMLFGAAPTWERVQRARSTESFALAEAADRRALSDLVAELLRVAPRGVVPLGIEERCQALGYALEVEGDRLWLVDATRRGGVVLGVYLGPLEHEVVVQAPHPFFDLQTGLIVARLFDEHPVRAVIIATAHRRMARGSDAAHSPEGALQAATLGVVEALHRPLVVQVHGFGDRDGRGAQVYVSGGRSWWRSEALVAAEETLSRRLDGVLVERGNSANGLGGHTNTQGRMLEGRAPVLLLEFDRDLRRRLAGESVARTLLLGAIEDIEAELRGTAP